MKVYLLLSGGQAWGGVATLFLFGLCFLLVHFVKLSLIGYGSLRKKSEKKQEKKADPPPEKKAEPVFYIVEKKRVRKKPSYDYEEPKRIEFPDENKV